MQCTRAHLGYRGALRISDISTMKCFSIWYTLFICLLRVLLILLFQVEMLDVLMGPNDQIINFDIYGEIRCTCELSGMPDLLLTLNRPSLIEDASLHRCVRINKFKVCNTFL